MEVVVEVVVGLVVKVNQSDILVLMAGSVVHLLLISTCCFANFLANSCLSFYIMTSTKQWY